MGRHIEEKQVALGDYQFFYYLMKPGFCWHGASQAHKITVVAVEGSIGDWAAYFETPSSGCRVKENGDKFPKDVAEQIFPDWATKYTWRY